MIIIVMCLKKFTCACNKLKYRDQCYLVNIFFICDFYFHHKPQTYKIEWRKNSLVHGHVHNIFQTTQWFR